MKLPWHRDVVTHRVNPHKHFKSVRNENGRNRMNSGKNRKRFYMWVIIIALLIITSPIWLIVLELSIRANLYFWFGIGLE